MAVGFRGTWSAWSERARSRLSAGRVSRTMKQGLLERLLDARAAKIPCALLTDLSSGHQALFRNADAGHVAGFGAELREAAGEALRRDRSRRVETDSGPVFIQVFNPPLRLVVVGAVHIAQGLVPIAEMTGYEVVIVDPRRAFASAARFPGAALVDEWPDDAIAMLAVDARTAIVTLTHDPKLDDPALLAALNTPAFYIGSLGSRRTHQTRLARLRAKGCEESNLARIHAPVGLDIGAQSPAEIATAIMAEIITVLREKRV